MAELTVDWSGCSEVERIAGKVSGQWLVKGTRILADGVIENALAGFSPEEIAGEIYEGMSVDAARAIIAYGRMTGKIAHPA
jgi:uncharacterized protein (DUF433 family)